MYSYSVNLALCKALVLQCYYSFMTCTLAPQADSRPPALPAAAVLFDNIKVTMTSKMLNGTERVLLDGVTTEDECRELHRLSNVSQHYTGLMK